MSEFLSIQIVEIPEPDPYLTLSIPATLDINYGDTQTPFDIQVKEGVFRNDMGIFEVGHVGIIRAVLLRRINARINTNVVAIPE